MKYKKIIALMGCITIMGNVTCQSVVAASVETETFYAQEEQTEEINSELAAELHMTEFAETEQITERFSEAAAEPEIAGMTEEAISVEQTEQVTEPVSEISSELPILKETEGVTEPGTEGIIEMPTETDAEEGTEQKPEPTTESVTEQGTETESITETNTEGQTEPHTESISEGKTEQLTETDTESLTETVNIETETLESETEQISEEESEAESETEEEIEENTTISAGYGYEYSSNYFWDPSWYILPDFRFTQVDKKCAIVEAEQDSVCVYDTASGDGTVIGRIPYFGLVFILEEGDDWTYIESGDVRGFIQSSVLKTGDYVELMMKSLGEYNFLSGISEVPLYENKAYTYTHTTTKEVVATKQYGIALFHCEVLEYPKETARAVGKAEAGNLMYILEITENGWYYVESGDVRGFIDPKLLSCGERAESYVDQQKKSDTELTFAEELLDPLENESLYYTLKSVRIAGSTVGTDISETAMSFVGKLGYVWGGNSLTYGADCSGFVQAVFESYGIILPRTAEAQGINGNEVASLKDAKAGDLVYYASGPHVGIYIGNGMVVQCAGDTGNTAANPGKGPTISSADYMPITSIRRYLIDTQDTTGDNGNRLDLTDYSQEQLELIWAIVAQEDNGSYEGALAVISSAMNRTESSTWNFEGGNALLQLTAAGQFCYSMDDYWKMRLNGNVPGYVKAAVNDCLKKGIRNHSYTCFRSTMGKTTGNGAVQIGGNWYFGT